MLTAQSRQWPIYSLIGEQKSKHRTSSYHENSEQKKLKEMNWLSTDEMCVKRFKYVGEGGEL